MFLETLHICVLLSVVLKRFPLLPYFTAFSFHGRFECLTRLHVLPEAAAAAAAATEPLAPPEYTVLVFPDPRWEKEEWE